jgi:integrase/recombinase XerD
MNNETLNFALEAFHQKLILQRYAINTIKSYKANASAFLTHFNTNPQNISLKQIEEYINPKITKKPPNPKKP